MNRQQAVQAIVEAFKGYEQSNWWKYADNQQRYLDEEGKKHVKESIVPITGMEHFFDAYLYAWLYRN